MDKKQLKAQRRQARTDRQREIDRMKYTHEWTSKHLYSVGYTRMQNTDVRCKKCGMHFWNFKMKPMTCNEYAVYDVISYNAAPKAPASPISQTRIGQVIGLPTGGLGGKE